MTLFEQIKKVKLKHQSVSVIDHCWICGMSLYNDFQLLNKISDSTLVKGTVMRWLLAKSKFYSIEQENNLFTSLITLRVLFLNNHFLFDSELQFHFKENFSS